MIASADVGVLGIFAADGAETRLALARQVVRGQNGWRSAGSCKEYSRGENVCANELAVVTVPGLALTQLTCGVSAKCCSAHNLGVDRK